MAYYYYREYYPDSSAIAMLAILMLALGLGPNTVVFAVFLYALLQLLRIRTLALQK